MTPYRHLDCNPCKKKFNKNSAWNSIQKNYGDALILYHCSLRFIYLLRFANNMGTLPHFFNFLNCR